MSFPATSLTTRTPPHFGLVGQTSSKGNRQPVHRAKTGTDEDNARSPRSGTVQRGEWVANDKVASWQQEVARFFHPPQAVECILDVY
jgi:hypothetical protein